MPAPCEPLQAVFLTLADFGGKQNLKTRNAVPMLQALKTLDPRAETLCRDYADFDQPARRIMPGGNRIPKLMSLGRRFFPRLDCNAQCDLLDRFAHRKLGTANFLITYPHCFFRGIHAMKQQGGLVVAVDAVTFGGPIDLDKAPPLRIKKYNATKAADYIVVFSEFARRDYIDNAACAPEKVFAVPTGTDTRHFQPGTKKDDVFRVLAVGNYGRRKGFQFLMEAWERLDIPNAELIVLGRIHPDMIPVVNDFRGRLRNFVTMETRDPLPYYQQASVLVHPSAREGSARVIYEAMACALPILCTPNSGSVIEDGKDGLLIPPRDPAAIANRIQWLYHHPSEARAMGEAAFRKVHEQYDWRHFQDRFTKALHTIVNS